MKTISKEIDGKMLVEIPESYVKLFSLKKGQIFDCRVKELDSDSIIINLTTAI